MGCKQPSLCEAQIDIANELNVSEINQKRGKIKNFGKRFRSPWFYDMVVNVQNLPKI
jgi:hypothetical protein